LKTISCEALAGVLANVPGVPRVVVSGNSATPFTVLRALDSAIEEYRLFLLHPHKGIPDREGVHYETPFVGAGMRGHERLSYFPCRLSRVPELLQRKLPPDIVILHTSRPIDGAVSLGIEVNILPAAIEAVRARGGLVIAQSNSSMPVTYGDAMIPLEDVDYLIEVDEPLTCHGTGDLDSVSAQIGERIASLVPRGATLQLGIGAIPDATLRALLDSRDLRVWSEMFSDGVLALEKAGCMDQDTPITASFSFGSAELYDWMDRNPRVRMLRTEKTNDPGAISQHRQVFSVNGALQVDLFGQANGSRVGHKIYSGFGGQTDFVVGATHSPGGHSIIALRSWHAKSNTSTVVPQLPCAVTSFQHTYIVTENGAASIWGNDSNAQARNIIENAAHPDARDALREAGRNMGLKV
jgi:acyl-CoA hydrolase